MIDVAEVPLAVADRFPTRRQLPPERLDRLSRDILAVNERDNIAQTEVLITFVGGRKVYQGEKKP